MEKPVQLCSACYTVCYALERETIEVHHFYYTVVANITVRTNQHDYTLLVRIKRLIVFGVSQQKRLQHLDVHASAPLYRTAFNLYGGELPEKIVHLKERRAMEIGL